VDTLQDVTWLKYLYSATVVERCVHGCFKVVAVAVPLTRAHHADQYRYRMFFFQPADMSPVMAINFESDLLGGWRLTLQTGARKRIVTTCDTAVTYETFRALALPLADKEALYSVPCDMRQLNIQP